MTRFVHYWTGYGPLCNTADARKRDSKSSPHKAEVTCERCKLLLERLKAL